MPEQTPNPNHSTLTREQMEEEIAKGRSILHNGAIITHIENLPSAAKISNGDPKAAAQAAAELDKKIGHLLDERDSLRISMRASEPVQPSEPAWATLGKLPVPEDLSLEDLEAGTLTQLLGIAYGYEVPDIDLLDSRTDVIAAIRQKAGYKPAAAPTPAAQPTVTPPAAVIRTTSLAEAAQAETIGLKTSAAPKTATKATAATPEGDPNAELSGLNLEELRAVAIESGVNDAEKLESREDVIAAIKAAASQ